MKSTDDRFCQPAGNVRPAHLGAFSIEQVENAIAVLPPRTSLADQVRAEALEAGARRAAARSGGNVHSPAKIRPAKAIEQLQGAIVDTPSDLIATAKRVWPELWARVVERARIEQIAPGLMLLNVIEAGLDR